MEIRRYEEKDFSTLASWWIVRESVIPSQHLVAGDGYIARVADKDICALFIQYSANAPICFITSLISDPESDKEVRGESIHVLLSRAEHDAKERGVNVVVTSTRLKSIEQVLEQHSYNESERDMVSYWKELN